jgi:hypothetical protein
VTAYPKTKPWRSEPYRRLVAALPCDRCGVEGYTQCAHGDQGKGMGIKSGDETCIPLCGPHPSGRDMWRGCHDYVGRGVSRMERREYEADAAIRTRARLRPECERLGIDLPEEP